MIVLIVGPSGVGKSTAVNSLPSDFPNVKVENLDHLAASWAVKQGVIATNCIQTLLRHIADNELFLGFGLQAVGSLASEHPGRHLVIDVGAGFQVANFAKSLHRLFPLVTITASPLVAYQRIREQRNDQRTFKEYAEGEFSTHRKRVYDSSKKVIDTSNLKLDETVTELACALHQILA